jgi:hypothetical protein
MPPLLEPTPSTLPPLGHRPVGQARRAQRAAQTQRRQLTEQVVTAGQAAEAEALAAATLTQADLTDAEMAAWKKDAQARLALIQAHPEQNLGCIEEQLAQAAQEPLRLWAQRAAQAKANAAPQVCPQCQQTLLHLRFVARTIQSRFGPLRVFRHYGWCPQCEQWHFPADYALGLDKKAPASPYLQEVSALLVSKMPPEQAHLVAQRLGFTLSRCTLDREAHRQGLKAQAARTASLAELDQWESLCQLSPATEGPPSQPYTLVIEIDAWNIRERDEWGRTEALRRAGNDLSRWHWVYMGTVFRLDHCGQTAGGRPIISQRGYVATRLGVADLLRQLYREALQRGVATAERVLVIADGAAWIWNAVQDRFPQAQQRLDLFHADQHLWAVAHDLYGQGTPEAQAWVNPLLQQVRGDETPRVIRTLSELAPDLTQSLQAKVQTQIEYFRNHQNRMQYKAILAARKACAHGTPTEAQRRKASEPLGSGAIESTCRQYQCRFKRTGQFWSTAGDEALMCLETFWRNNRWHLLFPHAQPFSAMSN